MENESKSEEKEKKIIKLIFNIREKIYKKDVVLKGEKRSNFKEKK